MIASLLRFLFLAHLCAVLRVDAEEVLSEQKYCIRAYETNDCDFEGVLDNDTSDPIQCLSNVDSFEKSSIDRYFPCAEFDLVNLPLGVNDEALAPCGQASYWKGEQPLDVLCYYNTLNDEFCVSLDDTGVPDCGPSQVATSVLLSQTKASCQKVLFKPGSCNTPPSLTPLTATTITNETINARNQDVNNQAKCSLSEVAPALVSDNRRTRVLKTTCYDNGNGCPADSFSNPTSAVLEGQEVVMVNSNLLAQVQGDRLCIAYEQTDSSSTGSTGSCQEVCMAMGETVTFMEKRMWVGSRYEKYYARVGGIAAATFEDDNAWNPTGNNGSTTNQNNANNGDTSSSPKSWSGAGHLLLWTILATGWAVFA